MIVTQKKTLNIPFLFRFMEYLEFLYFRLTNVFYLTYRALNVLSEECDLIQSELYRNSKSVLKRNDGVLYYDCTNYYLRLNKKMEIKNTEKVKNTVQTLSCRWDSLPTEMEFHWLSAYFQEIKMNRHL